MSPLLARAHAVLDELLFGLTLARPPLMLGLPPGEDPARVWAVSNRSGIFLSHRFATLSAAALRALIAHEIGHHLLVRHGGRFNDEEGATLVGLALLDDPGAHAALVQEARTPRARACA